MRFIQRLKEILFPTMVALSALSVSASAAFYSITGLSKLFAGASFEVIIMASSLEVSKLIIASLLYQYWDELNKVLRFYLTVAATTLVIITSMGIYGFLSAAYQETASKSGIIDKEINLLDVKRSRFIENREYIIEEKKIVEESISSLRDGISNNVIQYKDQETGQIITTTSSSNRRALQSQLDEAIDNKNNLSVKLESVTDSITSLDIKILNIESNSDVAAELGPLKYLSELTGLPMNKIINYLLLVIIFVFDPLAIALVIAANFLFKTIRKKENNNDLSQKNNTIIIEEIIEEPKEEIIEEPKEEIIEEPKEEIIEEPKEEIIEEPKEEIIEEPKEEIIEEPKEEIIEEPKEEPKEEIIEEPITMEKVQNNKRLVYKKRNDKS